LCVHMCRLLSNGVKAAARPTPRGFPFPSSSVPMVFVDVDGRESATARGGKINEKVGRQAGRQAALLACHQGLGQALGCTSLAVWSPQCQPGHWVAVTP
jgi:hypothetical protein